MNMPEKILGEFELFTDRLIGKGAWGEVYHGRQKSLNRPVAIKILKKELTQDESFILRFRREAETLAKITDDHIVQVYSAGEHEDCPYFVMEYVEGKPLSNLIESGYKFSIEEIIHITESVTRALKTAWESPARIVHRDIKPSNIMVALPTSVVEPACESDRPACRSGRSADRNDINILKSKIKVMDFGLAKVASGTKDATMAGTVIGTPKYISPEQGLGNTADIRSDIYSLGIVMYEMATGRIPFEGESAVSMIRHHIHDTAVLPSQFNPDIPQELEQIIMKCIQKNPEDRYASPEQLLDDLTAFRQNQKLIYASGLDGTIISPPAQLRRAIRTVLYSGIAGLVIVAGIVLTFIALRSDKTSPGPKDTANLTGSNMPSGNTDNNASPVVADKDEEFKVSVWTNKKEGEAYEEGEVIKYYFQTNKESYVYLYNMDAAGNIQMLFPNGYNKNNRIKANEVYTIPDNTMNFQFQISPPFGTERIKVIASLQPMKEMDIAEGESGFKDLGRVDDPQACLPVRQGYPVGDINDNKMISRSVEVVPLEIRSEATCTIITRPKTSKDEPTIK